MRVLHLFVLLALPALLTAQSKTEEKPKWDVNKPPLPLTEHQFTVNEGTWMNVDISPDGKTLAFDLLGDIYTMPISGGKATPLRQGLAWESQPRWSPDGQHLSFTSDAGGGDNIWVMKADGSEARQVTTETFRLLNNAVWSGNEYLIARKHFTSTRSLGAGEMWLYHISGGEGLQLTTKKNDQQDVNEPSASADGKYLYFSEDMYPGGFFQYNKDPNNTIFVIKRLDRETGKIEDLINAPGGACRPQINRKGDALAYVKRMRTETVLVYHELSTGQERVLYRQLSKDQQEAWTVFGIYPGFSWTPDDAAIVIWAKGKLQKIQVKNGSTTPIPFEANVKTQVAETVNFKQDAYTDSFTVHMVRNLVTSPDNKTVIFHGAGYLWKKSLPNGKPVRLTKGTDLEYEPAFSPDGKQLVYVTWNDEQYGTLQVLDIASGSSKKISAQPAIYRTPQFSPDGNTIVYRKEAGNEHQGYLYSKEPGIYTIPSIGGTPTKVTEQGEAPRFDHTGKRIYFQTGGLIFGALSKNYKSVKLDGSDEQTHFTGKYATQFIPSPDGQWVAFTDLWKAYIAPFPRTGKPIGLSADTKAVPVAQVARDAGSCLHWSQDSKTLYWTLGETYYSDALKERFKFLQGKGDSIPPLDSTGIAMRLRLKYDQPNGIIALTNATIITMVKDEVIKGGTIVVENNKIKAIGKGVSIPAGAKVIDCKGKTIMPGMVDVHAHLGAFRLGIPSQKKWEYYAHLAYGVTTTHDPSSTSEMTFNNSEMVKAGTIVGPRIFSTGTILYGADGDFKAVINNKEDALSALRRTKALGAFSVKSYNQPRRDQRQQVIAAAHELKMNVYPEGGSFFYHNLSQVVDGHTSIEHNIPVAPVYNDVLQLWGKTKTYNTPTLIVAYGAVNGEYYWYQHTNVWENNRLLKFTPQSVIDTRARHRTMIPEEEYTNGHILASQSCKKMQDAGINITLGSHGQIQGIGAHWELWMFVQGGMSNHQALRCATLNGATYLGMQDQIGSLQPGKLADLVVMDKNPLDNIRNSESISFVMVNGRLYDAATMNQVGNHPVTCGPFYWQLPGHPAVLETNALGHSQCVCRGTHQN